MRRTIYLIIGIAISALILMPIYYYNLLNTPASSTGKTVTFTVKRGANFRAITRELVNARIIKNKKGFRLAARIKRADKLIKAGEYDLSSAMTPLEVLNAMTTGQVKYYSLTFPEGYTIKDMATVLDAKGIVDAHELIGKAADSSLVSKLGFEGTSLEGYLFPDTYKFTKPMRAVEIIRMMTAKFNRVYNAGLKTKAKERGLKT